MVHLENEVNGSQNFEEVLTQKYEIYNRCHLREECNNFANKEIAYKLYLFSTLFWKLDLSRDGRMTFICSFIH